MKTQKQIRQDRAYMFLAKVISGFLLLGIFLLPATLQKFHKEPLQENLHSVAENQIYYPQSRSKKHQFFDVQKNHPYRNAIDYAYENNIAKGFNNATIFKPEDFVSRAELVKIVSNFSFEKEKMQQCMKKYSHSGRSFYLFSDVPTDSWFASSLCITYEDKIIKGYPDGYFRPHQRVNFMETAKILSKIFDIQTEAKRGDPWFATSVRGLEKKGAIPKSVSKLDSPVTRGEFMEMLYRLLEEKTEKPTKSYADFSLHSSAPCNNCLVIPQLQIEVPIVYGAAEEAFQNQQWRTFEKEVLTALRKGVVHYPNTAKPGMIGNVFISGHSSFYQNDPGRYNKVFAKLGELKEGDEYIIYYNGTRFIYKIREEQIIESNDFSYLSPSTNKELSTLMTCWPVNTNRQRKVFVAERVM